MRYYVAIVLLLLSGCVTTPEFPTESSTISGKNGAYILCEGLMGMDNSTITRYDESSGTVINDYYAKQNNGLRLGDTGNDMVQFGEHLFVPVTKSRAIEKIIITNGTSVGRLKLDKKEEPYRIAILNDTTAYCTLVSDYILEFNPKTMQRKGAPIKVGPGPEGIAVTESNIFVANSGYGDLRQSEPKASTISVLDQKTKTELSLISNLINVRSVQIAENGRALYAMYSNLNTPVGLKGGIVRFDSRTLQETNRWEFRSPSMPEFSQNEDSLFVADSVGLWVIDLAKQTKRPHLLFSKTTPKEIWYSVKRHPQKGELWISVYPELSQNNGWVTVRTLKGAEVKRFDVLLIPSKILFF